MISHGMLPNAHSALALASHSFASRATASAGFSGVRIGTQHSNKQAQNAYRVINCARAQARPLQSTCEQAAVVCRKEAGVVELGVLHDVELEHGALASCRLANCCSTSFKNALCTFFLAFMGRLTHSKESFMSQLPMMPKASSHYAFMQTVRVGA